MKRLIHTLRLLHYTHHYWHQRGYSLRRAWQLAQLTF